MISDCLKEPNERTTNKPRQLEKALRPQSTYRSRDENEPNYFINATNSLNPEEGKDLPAT